MFSEDLEEGTAFIFRIEEKATEITNKKQAVGRAW
jgi:hypothetical protein